ncbi:hypothetical protein RRG08_056862 [Elysia crispata]|uniref:Uncharacterized protein n=1 Tax=Elysia crispata TaxID=231223 RepID=A0AAE0Z3F4_9GAST|nr:hypothetical protein RRG08_056862 [Elysia crispata]
MASIDRGYGQYRPELCASMKTGVMGVMAGIDRRYGQYRLELPVSGQYRPALCTAWRAQVKEGIKSAEEKKRNRREKKREQADIRGPSPCLLLTPTSPLTTPAASAE